MGLTTSRWLQVYKSSSSDSTTPRIRKALEQSTTNAAWLKAEMAQLERRQSQFLSAKREQSENLSAEKYKLSHPQRLQIPAAPSVSLNPKDFPEKMVDDERHGGGYRV
jgi:hypothetical protein